MGALMKAKEVAQYIGVERQTIMNWEKEGLLKGMKNGREWYFSRDAVEELIKPLKQISKCQENIEDKKKKLEDKSYLYDKYCKCIKELDMDVSTYKRLVKITIALVTKMFEIDGDTLNDREIKILKDVFSLKAIKDVSYDFGMTESNVRIIINNAIEKILVSRKYSNKLEVLKSENEMMKSAIHKLELENSSLRDELSLTYNGRKLECSEEMEKKINIEIENEDLSVRAVGCIQEMNIKTIGMLASLRKRDLMSIRNLGKKTLYELECILNKYKLNFGDRYCRSIFSRRWNGKMYVGY